MHTPDVDGPLTYSVMADDTVAYLDQEVDGPAHLVGWSDGAVVALLVALRRPDLVRRTVLIGQYYNSSGKTPGSTIEADLASPDALGFLRDEYARVSPDGGDHFPVVHAKTMQMIRTEPEIDLGSLGGVAAPTLVLQGDRDEVTVAHSQAVVAALPDARLAVLPGTHGLPLESPDVVNPLWSSSYAAVRRRRGEPPAPASALAYRRRERTAPGRSSDGVSATGRTG